MRGDQTKSPVFGPALVQAAALLRGRWGWLAGLALAFGILRAVGAQQWLLSTSDVWAVADGRPGEWLVAALFQSVLVVGILAILRRASWPSSRLACLTTWWVTVLILQLATTAPLGFLDYSVELQPAAPTEVAPSATSAPDTLGTTDIPVAARTLLFLFLVVLQGALTVGTLLAPAAVVLDNKGPVRSAIRSAAYLARAWPSLIVMGLTISIVLLLSSLAVALLSRPLAEVIPYNVEIVSEAVVATLATLLATVFCAGLYLRLRGIAGDGLEDTAQVFD